MSIALGHNQMYCPRDWIAANDASLLRKPDMLRRFLNLRQPNRLVPALTFVPSLQSSHIVMEPKKTPLWQRLAYNTFATSWQINQHQTNPSILPLLAAGNTQKLL
jgi:hypothetical protein